jgi:hypothetical protein
MKCLALHFGSSNKKEMRMRMTYFIFNYHAFYWLRKWNSHLSKPFSYFASALASSTSWARVQHPVNSAASLEPAMHTLCPETESSSALCLLLAVQSL